MRFQFFKNKKRFQFVAILLLSINLAACSGQEEDNSTLTLGCSNFSDSLDPSASPNSAWGTARYGIGEGLFRFDESMNAKPHLAESYTVNDAKTHWTFSIRKDVKFSNGKALKASDIVAAFEYLYSQEKNNIGTNRPSQFMELASIVFDDNANTVTIITKKPYVDLSKVLSHVNFIILDIESDMAQGPVGTGPYKVAKNDIGISLSLEKNENYWKGTVPFEKLEIVYMEDSTTKSLALQAGDIDMVDSITTSHDLDTLRKSPDFNVSETLSTRTAFSYINHNNVLGNDVLREAVLLAIDDETICEITVGGVYTSGHSVLPPTIDYGYKNLVDKSSYNLELAKKKLDDAGIIDTNNDGIRELNGENISLNYISYVMKSLDIVSEAVSVNLSELGIDVNLKVLDSDTHWNMVVNKEFDLAICSWLTVPVGDPVGYMGNWYSKSSLNYSSYQNDMYDSLYEELIIEINPQKQKEIIEKLQQILIDDYAVMVNGYYESNLSSSAKIEGVVMPMSESYWITTDIKPASK